MLKSILFCVVCSVFLFSTELLAAERIESFGIDLSTGYRIDQLDWSIAGVNNNPNILSELDWSDLEILQLQMDGWLETQDLLWLKTNTLFVGRVAYGYIFVGDNRDSDYAGDNRTLEWSRSENQSDDGFTFDVSGGFGPKYELLDGKLSVAPLLGYSFHIQDLSITEGRQTVSDNATHDMYFDPSVDPNPLGLITSLDSSYTAYWWGPWLGVMLQLRPLEKWSFDISAEYHIVEYFAEANWNLRSDLAHPTSFEQEAHGTGFVLTAKSIYELNRNWSAFAAGNMQFWQTGDGVDTTYKSNGSRTGAKLNEVNWESYSIMFGLRYRF